MKSHRGLSSVIGAVFLIAIVIGSLSYITYSLEIMGNFSEALITAESRLKDKQGEAFEITSIDITGADKLDAVIKNTGQIPLKITTLYLDKQGSTDPVLKIPIDVTIAPGRSFNFLDELIDIDIDDDAAYSMKFITSRGETNISYLHSAADQPVDITVVAIPDVVASSFSSTIIMTVVNNMTNNNSLLNLTPVEPDCGPGCTKLSGPIPAKYESLSTGDVAIFRWSFQLSGDAATAFIFGSSLVGGVPGNTGTDTVVIGDILEAQLAGQSLSAVGFGGQEGAPNAFVFHVEDARVPDSNYQMSLTSPDNNPGIQFPFTVIGDRLQWFSSNASGTDVHIPEGNWNASLRYSSPRLPSVIEDGVGSNIHDNIAGGHTFHFNTDTTRARLDSGQISGCTSLATDAGGGGISGATWFATGGVNSSGAYKFDGNDYIRIANSGSKGDCNYVDKQDMTIAGWFNATIGGGNSQAIFAKSDTGEGGYEVSLENGNVVFRFDEDSNDFLECATSGTDYRDQEWHHFVGTGGYDTGDCTLYVDGVEEDTDSGGIDKHDHEDDDPVYIGMRFGTQDGFEGYLDDIMFWGNYKMSAGDVTALKAYSFGENVTKMNFVIDKTDGFGNFVSNIDTSLNYDLSWSDQFDGDVSHSWVGGNYTAFLPEETLFIATPNRINFTMSYASGEPLNLLIDESDFTGSVDVPLSTFLQVPDIHPPEKLPTYLTFDNDLDRVAIFIYNAGDLGAWLTYQGTRVVFNGTGGHFAGLVLSIDDGENPVVDLSSEQDGPFIPGGSKADVDFWHPEEHLQL